MNDNEKLAVEALLRRDPEMTRQVFYVQCYPLFKAVYEKYYTDCADCVEFINEIYIYILTPHQPSGKCYLEAFSFKCHFVHWLKIVAETYCRQLYKKKKEIIEESIDAGDRLLPDTDSLDINLSSLNAMDISTLLSMMPNERYRQIIRLHYLEDRSIEDTAARLGMTLDNFYNKHRLAKQQFLKILHQERDESIRRSRIPNNDTARGCKV